LDEIDALQRQVDAFRTRTGGPATDWIALAGTGLVRGVPVDPAGVPYELTPEGRVRLAPSSPLWPLPEEPQRMMAPPS
jgi:hypothetical protein